jgi:hypothetical protein
MTRQKYAFFGAPIRGWRAGVVWCGVVWCAQRCVCMPRPKSYAQGGKGLDSCRLTLTLTLSLTFVGIIIACTVVE